MDQGYFRTLLSTKSESTSAPSTSRGSLLPQPGSTKQKIAVISSTEAAFKPRKVKKAEKYRDRASERRHGEGNDYAQVEAVLEEFEKSTADQDKSTVDSKRSFLGGDEEHSILVKGLDMALLERNKAKEASGKAAEEDDELEKAFLEVGKPSAPEVPPASGKNGKKRTREDIIRDLKNKKSGGEPTSSTSQDPELNKGKFKPIGFKPIGAPSEEKPKKRKVKSEGEKKKKKRKVAEDADNEKGKTVEITKNEDTNDTPGPAPNETAAVPPMQKVPEPEPEIPDDFDIFADAGEYEGVDLGDDDDDESESRPKGEKELEQNDMAPTNPKLRPGRWFADDDGDEEMDREETLAAPLLPAAPDASGSVMSIQRQPQAEDEEGQLDEEEEPARLVALSSSTLPSIKDFLAMDEAAEKAEKKKKRKEKQKNKQGEMTAEARADRDYKR
ncbi:C-24(28) sterol reductase [Marasmius tenuissimus]|uniref:C-24(28) sterol reductase n=1 Tax=Marasmius tenuissimus TaxID=585030 RepID=A0ABR2ZVV0_9AGAR